MIRAHRYHDISCGHRVYGHEGKCAHLHGHNYRIHFTLDAVQLDQVGRVLDFGLIKSRLCEWLEQEWDHKFLIWEGDPWRHQLTKLDSGGLVVCSFNPTAEYMAAHLLQIVSPKLLDGLGCRCIAVTVEETRKCSASADLTA